MNEADVFSLSRNWIGRLERELFEDIRRSLPGFGAHLADKGGAYELTVELPGFSKDEIRVETVDGDLLITAARPGEEGGGEGESRRYLRSFSLEGVDPALIRARYENGLLTLSLPKKEKPPADFRQIRIE